MAVFQFKQSGRISLFDKNETSEKQAEYQINDRLSFKEFLGLSAGDRVPDSRTIWLFQENMIQKNLEEKLFEQFCQYLYDLGLYVNEGKRT